MKLESFKINPNSIMIRFRWVIFLVLVFLANFYEYLEHPKVDFFSNRGMINEMILFALLLSVAFIFLELLLAAVSTRDQVFKMLELRNQISLQLSMADTWNDFCQRLLEIPRTLVKVKSEHLFAFNEKENRFILEASWPADPANPIHLEEILATCVQWCQNPSESKDQSHQEVFRSTTNPDFYCVPLRYANKVIGWVNFEVDGEDSKLAKLCEAYGNIGNTMATVLEAFIQKRQRAEAEIANATRAERLAIAQDLHDTIGQNLCYIRLKLDQMSTPQGLREVGDIRQELENLRDNADESYDLVRGALGILHLENTPQFVDLLRAHGLMVAERAGFSLTIEMCEEPKPLSQDVMRHAFYAFKEALTNIERHAQAKNVIVHLQWDVQGLEVMIQDDGLGFDTRKSSPTDHYGLDIMKNRVESAQGHFEIDSSLDHGTKIKFMLPYASDLEIIH